MFRLRQGLALSGIGLIILAMMAFCVEEGAALGKKKVPIQPNPMPVPGGGGSAAALSSVKIVEDSQLRRVINVGRDCIKDQDWPTAVDALQSLLSQ